MEILLLVVVLIVLFVVLSRVSTGNELAKQLMLRINKLEEELKKIKSGTVPLSQERDIITSQKKESEIKPAPASVEEKEEIKPPEPVVASANIPAAKTENIENVKAPLPRPVPPPRPVVVVKPSEPRQSAFSKWLANNPDIEKFIGENLVNKIGIAILVLGIAFFVKYAIDQNWINEIGRVCIGLLCGGILIALAHRLRKNYRSFSSVLAGGAIAVFYFTIAFAYREYELFNQSTAFVIMVVITAFAILLSVLYNRMELGIIAALGGFLTPFLVSSGSGNYVVLFTYLAILNAGLIVLAYYKQWRPINFIAFFFTVIIYGGWVITRYYSDDFSYGGTFIFGTVFYLMFVTMNLVYHVIRKGKLKAFDFLILISINLFYYAAGYFLLKMWELHDYTGLFTALLGLFNLILSYVLFRKRQVDRNFIYLLIGITLSFISLAAPVQLSGNYITLFWAAEMAVLLWLGQKSGIRLISLASKIVTGLVIISLLMDWINALELPGIQPVIANKGFITSVVVAVAMFVCYVLLRKQQMPGQQAKQYAAKEIRSFYIVAGTVILFVAGFLEIYLQFTHRYSGVNLERIYLPFYVYAFVLIMFLILSYYKVKTAEFIRFALPAVLFLAYLLNNFSVYQIEIQALISNNFKGHFVVHWISVILLLLIIGNLIRYVVKNTDRYKNMNWFTWIAVTAIVIILSIEIQHMYVWAFYNGEASIYISERDFSKAGLSILWGVLSFVFIWLGLRYRYKALRIIALCLFGVTILKLFVYDLSNIPPGGKIAAFTLLGVLLLIVSFMYQRLKKIIIDDKPNENVIKDETSSI